MSVFASNFSFMDNPGGETEDVASMKAAGFSGLFCNVHAYQPEQWDHLRAKCKAAGMFCGPWARVIEADNKTFSSSVLDHLIRVADDWGTPFIVNAEVELTDTGSVRTKEIATKVGSREAAVSTLPWLQNPPSVDWKPIGHLPALLQIFPVEQPGVFPPGSSIEKQAADCLWHAHDVGVKCAYFTFGTYRGMDADWFKLQAPFSIFTGNQVGARQEWSKWKPTSTGFKACEEVVPPVAETPWYKKPYVKAKAVGPAHLPRALKPPSKNGGVVMTGHDVMAAKRMISKAQRWLPWEPTNWDSRYSEMIAFGRGTGMVGDSGLRGVQRQEGMTEDGILDDDIYQVLRKILIPTGPNKGQHVLDATCVKLIAQAAYEFSDEAKYDKIRAAMTDFCLRAEAHESIWHYSQARPFRGLGLDPETTHIGDCSSYVIMVYYWARQETGLNVTDPSGYRFSGYGNTSDNLDGHNRITSGNYIVGDLAHYDGHVTICRKSGSSDTSRWSSFGSESGPQEETLFYRPDFIKVVRPPLMV